MNLCDFCIHYAGMTKTCVKIPDFVRPVGQRVFTCTDFKQFPLTYAAVTYCKGRDGYPNDPIVIGCVGAKPAPRQRNKNQVSFKI